MTPGTLTLAICKPAIRRTAQVGDVIFAFGTNDQDPPNRLVYIATVTKHLTDGAYYDTSKFQRRADCIYRRQKNGKLVLRKDAKFHAQHDARPRDVGHPSKYKNARVLISTDFRYFGGAGTDQWKQHAPELKRLVERLKQGHRVQHLAKIRKQLCALKDRTWDEYAVKKIGTPLLAGCQPRNTPDDPTLEVNEGQCGYIKDSC